MKLFTGIEAGVAQVIEKAGALSLDFLTRIDPGLSNPSYLRVDMRSSCYKAVRGRSLGLYVSKAAVVLRSTHLAYEMDSTRNIYTDTIRTRDSTKETDVV